MTKLLPIIALLTMSLLYVSCSYNPTPVTYTGTVTAVENGVPPGEVYTSAIYIDGKKITVWPVPTLIIGARYRITVVGVKITSAELLDREASK